MKHTTLSKKDFESILKNYSIGGYIKHEKLWWSIKNTLYKLDTTKGNFILKIYESQNKKEITKNIKLVQDLRNKGVKIVKTYVTISNNFVFEYKNKPLVIQEFIQGEKRPELTISYVRDLAHNLSIIDKNLSKIKISNVRKNQMDLFSKSKYRSTNIIDDFPWDKIESQVIYEINRDVIKKNLRKSIIHSDLSSSNLIFKKGKIKSILDWDDLKEDYLVSDFSITLSHAISLSGILNKNLIREFSKEYQKIIKLNSEEKKASYYFIKIRLLSGIVWCDLNRKSHKEKKEKLTEWTKNIISFYKEFDKLKLEDYLKLLEVSG